MDYETGSIKPGFKQKYRINIVAENKEDAAIYTSEKEINKQ